VTALAQNLERASLSARMEGWYTSDVTLSASASGEPITETGRT